MKQDFMHARNYKKTGKLLSP